MKSAKRAKRAARQLFRLCLVDARLDEARARQVATLIAASRQRGTLRLLAEFQRRLRLDRNRHTAYVESAAPLGDRLRTTVSDRLTRAYGPALATSFRENPALIGGLRIRVGSDVYDGSIRARLAALEARL
jgi:F-type H+-transporting ATPase subunit delta